MRKLMGGVLRFLVMAALIAACAWNAVRVQELEARLARLETGRGPSSRPQAPEGPGPLDALLRSKGHADRAQRLLQEGRLDLARRELAQAGTWLREAGRKGLGETPDLSVLTRLRGRIEELTRQAEALVRASDSGAAPDGKEARK